MPKRQVIETHVYEFSFRIEQAKQEPAGELAQQIEDILRASPLWSSVIAKGTVSGRELCFDHAEGEYCLMTEGHRGRHEGPTGRRWGDDL